MNKFPKNPAFVDKVRRAVEVHDLLPAGAPVVLMVSGGSDSVAMARLLPELFLQNRFSVLHVNHLLRGQAANEDEAFVVELCRQLGLPCVVERVDVASIAAAQNDNVEQAGRKLRYSLANAELDRLCEQLGVAPELGRIATAHTIDDRAETLLMRIIVGGGGGSLSSIPYQNQRVVRPLLDCNRKDLRDFLTELNQLWHEDETNSDTAYSRAYVRHELLPLLEARNPRILDTLAKTASVLATESAYLDCQAREILPLNTASFNAPLAILRRAIYIAYKETAQKLAPDARIDFDHIDLIAQKGAHPGFACHLPGGIELRNIKGNLVFSAAKPPRHTP